MAESASLTLRIPDSGFRDLAQLAEHAEKLVELVSFTSSSPAPADPIATAKFVSDGIHIPERSVREIMDGLATLRSLMERQGLSGSEVLELVDSSVSLHAPAPWKENYVEKWARAKQYIVNALASIGHESAITVHQKVRELTYAHQNILTNATLMTDLRPVFNTSADKILAVVLTHVLTITYQDGTSVRRIEFALDAGDVAKLGEIVDRAQRKTATIQTSVNEKTGLNLIVAGAPVS